MASLSFTMPDHSASASSSGSNANGARVNTIARQICTCSSFSPHIREIYLSPLEAGELLRSIETVTIVGLPNRALIGMMVLTLRGVTAVWRTTRARSPT